MQDESTPIHTCLNFVGGACVPPASGNFIDVKSPCNGSVISRAGLSDMRDIEAAVTAARAAMESWQAQTVKSRAAIMFRFHELVAQNSDELARMIVHENGKNLSEALASVAKGNETVEWACSLPQIMQGRILEVSRGITCQDGREPIGIVACIVPFNFPFMVPMWTIPILLTSGNCVILKPSEKVPMTMTRIAQLLTQAGIPSGVFQILHGTIDVVNGLCDHPAITGVTFVGSSKVAELVTKRCRDTGKRVLALGGAKNHLVALPDCDVESTSQDIVASFAGCCGQRCMAAAALIVVGSNTRLVDKVIERTRSLQPGTEGGMVGPLIDTQSVVRVRNYLDIAEQTGVGLLVDGRSWMQRSPGNWFGPSVLLHSSANDPSFKDEIFGPVLSIIHVGSWEEALKIEADSPYGNAACIYTSDGASAEYFSSKFRAGMIGVNVGIPVPREPFSFGGLYGTRSKFGDFDITGEGCLEFGTNRRKITKKWVVYTRSDIGSTSLPKPAAGFAAAEDKANFNGRI